VSQNAGVSAQIKNKNKNETWCCSGDVIPWFHTNLNVSARLWAIFNNKSIW